MALWHRMVDMSSDASQFERSDLEFVLREVLEVGEAGAKGVKSAKEILESLKTSSSKGLLDLIRHLTT